MKKVYKTIANNIKRLMEKRGLSQYRISKNLNGTLSQSTLSRILNCKHNDLDFKTFIVLADYFNVRLDWLIGRDITDNDTYNELLSNFDVLPAKEQKLVFNIIKYYAK